MRALSPLDARAGSGELRRLGGAVAQDAVVVLGGFADGFKRRGCGGGTRRVRGDVDGNGVVDIDDIVLVVLNFGIVC